MQEIKQQKYYCERALFNSHDLLITDTVFAAGESPLKECSNLEIRNSLFRWRYPLWYCKNVKAEHCSFFEDCRAGMWYTDNLTVTDAISKAPKCYRRCHGVVLRRVTLENAPETLWHCTDVTLENVRAQGDYFCMNSSGLNIDQLDLVGKYSFDGVSNVTIRNSRLMTKDAFWNSDNVTVYDSFISAEYLGWNSRNLTLINCTIESLQGMCYVDNLVMQNCKMLNSTLAFEYSSVQAELQGQVDSVINPRSGRIKADAIGQLIIEPDVADATKTVIDCPQIGERLDVPPYV